MELWEKPLRGGRGGRGGGREKRERWVGDGGERKRGGVGREGWVRKGGEGERGGVVRRGKGERVGGGRGFGVQWALSASLQMHMSCHVQSKLQHTQDSMLHKQLTVAMLKWLGKVFVGYWLRMYSALTPSEARDWRK